MVYNTDMKKVSGKHQDTQLPAKADDKNGANQPQRGTREQQALDMLGAYIKEHLLTDYQQLPEDERDFSDCDAALADLDVPEDMLAEATRYRAAMEQRRREMRGEGE